MPRPSLGPTGLAACLTLAALDAPTAPLPLSQTQSFKVALSCAAAMRLFTAPGERLWADGWDPRILSGATTRGSVFTTEADGRETVWIVTEYAPEQGRASYARIAQGSNMGLVDVRCRAAAHGGSEVTVTYTLTGLDAKGGKFVADFLDPVTYAGFIREWETAVAEYLKKHPTR